MLHEEATKAWQRQGAQHNNDLLQSANCLTTGTTHRPGTRHHRRSNPWAKSHNAHQHGSPGRTLVQGVYVI